MKTVVHDHQRRHYPKAFLVSGRSRENPEHPARMDALLAGAEAAGLAVETPQDYGLAPVAAVHSPEYIEFLRSIHGRWQRMEGASEEVIPNVHPDRRATSYPDSPVGQAGYHTIDTSCPISAETFDSARWSANTAVHAAHLLATGEAAVYALCRPPGHHASRDQAGGFCYFNNNAIAAQWFRARGLRPAILDVDLHHGNGTQGIFYDRDDVLTVSVHVDTRSFYPFFWGQPGERGERAGRGYNLNLPVPRGTTDDGFLAALQRGIERVALFAPDVLIVALGLDAFVGDPFAGLAVTTPGFGSIGTACASLGLPTLVVQEGGYLCAGLGDNLTRFLDDFRHAHRTRPLAADPSPT